MSLRCQNELCRSGLFPKFVVLDFQRDGLLIGYGIKFLKLVFYSLKNVIVTGGAKELKCNLHTVEKMTKVPQGFDFSFLNDEEARKILQVLERNEELQRAEKDRIRYRANFSFFPRAWVQQWPRASAASPESGGRGAPSLRGHLSAAPGRAASARSARPGKGKSALSFSRKDFGVPGWCSSYTRHPRRARLRVSGPAGWGAPLPARCWRVLWCVSL